jgi:hypothetical protein
MTTPEVDQELERLFSVAREATAPDAAARERIRAGLAPRLTSSLSTARSAWSPSAWLGVGAAVLGVGAVAVWLSSAPPSRDAHALTTTPAPVTASPALEAAPAAAPAPISAPSPSAEALPPAPSLPASKPIASSPRSVDPAEELRLVRAMQQALRSGNPSQALALAADHVRRFPRGALAEEREGVRAVARCQLAAPDARAPILNAVTQRFASSPYGARVKAACQ